MKKGKVIIISGPSGSGKTTLSNRLLSNPLFKRKVVKSISTTTRPKRKGERHGRDYLFLSHRRFLYKRRQGHFLESQKVFDNYYGTPKKNVEDVLRQGKNVLLCIDVKGAKVVYKQIPEAITIFIKVPSMAVLKNRLGHRGTETKESLTLRLRIAQEELKEVKHYKHVVVNDNLQTANKKLEKILCNELGINTLGPAQKNRR